MSRRRNIIKRLAGILSILFIVVLMLPLDGLGADKQQFCNDYATKAVEQYNLGKQYNLPGIVPPVWSNDRNGHFNWCMAAPENIVNSENAKRQAYLDQHIPKSAASGKESFCNNYADNAVKQYNQAKQLKLSGTVPPSWSPNRDGHFKWCMTVPQNVAQNEQGIRQGKIDEYKDALLHDNQPSAGAVTGAKWGEFKPVDMTKLIGLKKNIDICEHYAQESVNQNKRNILLSCGFKNTSWSNDYNAHKNWCLHGNNNGQADKILADREKQLLGCKGNRTIWIPEMVLGLRESKREPFPYLTDPIVNYLLKKGINPVMGHVRDETSESGYVFHGISRGWDWVTVDKGNFTNADQYNLPPGVVIGLQHTMDNKPVGIFGIFSTIKYAPESIGKGSFYKKCGGDLGAPAGEGLCWYESTGLNFTDWSKVDKLPRGTVIGLKHSANQPNKKLIWQDHVYDPTDPSIQPPPGFIRIDGGDGGGPSGKGFCWYEKITGK